MKNRNTIYMGLYLALVLIIWTALSLLPGPKSVQLSGEAQGIYDLKQYDFEDTVYLTAPVWQSWAEKLYLPDELVDAPASVSQQTIDHKNVQYATHRLFLNLPAGTTYGISLSSANYAMKIYIDGREAGHVGIPAETREDTLPQERDVIYYFTSSDTATEIVVQVSNFVHHKGVDAPTLTIGTAENINQLDTIIKLKSGLIFGTLLTAGLYHLAIFLMNRRQVATLIFSLLCFSLALVASNFIELLFPAYNDNWQVAVRMEYILFLISICMLVLLVNKLFPRALHKWVFYGYLGICTIYGITVLFTDTTFFTRGVFGIQMISIALAIYGFIRLAMRLKEKKIKNLLAFLGISFVALFSIYDILNRNGLYLFGYIPRQSFGASEGMVFFVFCYALLLSIEQAEVNKRLENAKEAIAGAEARYHALIQQQEVKRTPAARLVDFGLTNRETEVAILLLDGKSRSEISALLFISIGTVNTHCTNIYKKIGCSSVTELARLITPSQSHLKKQ